MPPLNMDTISSEEIIKIFASYDATDITPEYKKLMKLNENTKINRKEILSCSENL